MSEDQTHHDDRARVAFSVVIPAHNESAVIERCLRAVLEGAPRDGLDVVVVCNGCTDDTAARARSFGPPVRVLELAESSKPAALNTGDRAARSSPRIFVDADVTVNGASLRAVARELATGRALAAAPALRVDLTGVSRAVRMYYRIWMKLPYARRGLVGSGVYGVSEAGRARFDTFPDVIGDDAFIRSLYADHERATVVRNAGGAPAWFTVFPPRRLRELIMIETRRRAGGYAAKRLSPAGPGRATGGVQAMGLAALALRVWLWPSLALYCYVKIESRRRFRGRRARGLAGEWMRDESSRVVGGGCARENAEGGVSAGPEECPVVGAVEGDCA